MMIRMKSIASLSAIALFWTPCLFASPGGTGLEPIRKNHRRERQGLESLEEEEDHEDIDDDDDEQE